MKRTRVLIGNFKRTPKGYQDPALRAWLEMCFTPLRYQFQNNTLQYLLTYFFWLNTLKGTAKAPTVDLLRLNTPRGTKTACDEFPVLFI